MNRGLNMFGMVRMAAAVAVLAAVQLSATPILLNTSPLPGTQPANQGQQTVADWLDSLTPAVNDIGNAADLSVNQGDPAPAGYPSFGANVNPLTLPVGDYDYLVLHWGGKGGGVDLAYDLTGCPDGSTAAFANPVGVNGLSSYRYYNPNGGGDNHVPEAGSTAMMLGTVLASVGLLRRSKKA
jgi:anti-sigma factor RsiW